MAQLKGPLLEELQRAIAAYRSGNFVEAEQLCEKIVADRADVFDALHLLAFVQSKLNKNRSALANYDRALKLRPNYAEAWSNRGIALQYASGEGRTRATPGSVRLITSTCGGRSDSDSRGYCYATQYPGAILSTDESGI